MSDEHGPLLIIADTYRQACHYAREHDLGREGRGWRFCRGVQDVRGRHGGRYVVLSIPGHRPSWIEIEERHGMLAVLRMNGFEPLS